ncbi:MAG TPA: SDR family oxidoreductase [Gemmataceae bacterium]|jgi:NADP-dependent 3-hydroxy acid dehydrogenase YdfG|nr:SDR family oxidoreductase [Gemmataceae bacterium]
MNRLANKVALITGGGSGIGLETARLFLGDGAKVAIAGRDDNKLKQAAKQLAGGDRIFTASCDVTQLDQVRALVQKVTDHFGPIDILVNNAGLNIKERSFRDLTPELWHKVLRANLDGAFYCVHAIVPGMIERKDGVVINISSISGKRAYPLGGLAYVAAKHGMSGIGLCLGAEEKDSGVRFCNIYPGEVDTPILKDRPTPLSADHLSQILKPEDVAAAVLFVATLPARASVPELIIKPTNAVYL